MRTLLTVANRRPVDLISPLLVQEEQITSVGSTGHKSAELARFSCAVRAFSASSAFFTRYPHFWPFAIRAAPCTRWCSSAPCRSASANAARTRSAKNADYLPTSSANQINQMLKRKEVERAFLGIIRLVKEETEGMDAPKESTTMQKPK